jgi:hypothetical protein
MHKSMISAASLAAALLVGSMNLAADLPSNNHGECPRGTSPVIVQTTTSGTVGGGAVPGSATMTTTETITRCRPSGETPVINPLVPVVPPSN